MKKNQHITAFYLETILLIVVFMTIIMLLTNVFGAGRSQSVEAKRLTNAVCLAENAAEAVSASDSFDVLQALLDEADNTELVEGSPAPTVDARYDEKMQPDPEGRYHVQVSWEPEAAGAGTGSLVSSDVTVTYEGMKEPIYHLETAVYLKEVGE